jgi:predicted transcriptional regulator
MNKVLPLTSITVPTRARLDYGDIPDLARKIMSTKGMKFGSIIIEEMPDGTNVLRAGGRRYKAHELILSGTDELWEKPPTEADLAPYRDLPCEILKDLTDEDRVRIEFIENMGRKDFTWDEAAALVQAFHEKMQAKFGVPSGGQGKSGWGTRDTARELGLTMTDVVYYLQLYKGLQVDPSLKDIRQKSKALTKIKRTTRQSIADLLDITDFDKLGIKIQCGDSKEVLETCTQMFDLVITDPPWGIDFEGRISEMRKESIEVTYDTNYDPMDTLDILMKAYNLLKDFCPIYMFYSSFPEKVREGQALLIAAGFAIEPIPLVWYKKHLLAHDARETRHGLNYETILYGWKKERPVLNSPSRNVLECQIAFTGRIHASEKPEQLLTEIILLHTKEGDHVLDPFGGSCKVADACKSTKRKCLVVEKDEGLVKMASLRIRGI